MTVNKQPVISIITVVLNGAQTLEKALQSVFDQRFTDYEYIILDGGSTDGTLDILRKHDRHITLWRSEPDEGVYDAMNKAIQFTKGQWVYFLGADDFLTCDLEEVAQFLKDKQTIYYGDVYRPAINRRYDGHFSPYKLASRNICHQSIFYPRSVWDKYSFKLTYPVFSDHEFNMRCFSDPDLTLQYIPVTIATFNDKEGISPTRTDTAFEADRMKLIKANFPYRVYLLAAVRFWAIRCLIHLNLNNAATNLYHFILRQLRKIEKKS